jgi:hypothetical protein
LLSLTWHATDGTVENKPVEMIQTHQILKRHTGPVPMALAARLSVSENDLMYNLQHTPSLI